MRTATRSTLHRLIALAACGAVGATTLIAFEPSARADEVSPTGKGIVGGALLGGEVVTITEAIIGIKPAWPYAIGFGVGAIGGGVAGYFIEKGSSDGRVPVYMLAGGLALVIPDIVLVLNATRYMPSEGATEDKPPPNAPPANPGAPGGSVVSPTGNEPSTTPAPATPSTAPAPSGGGGASPPAAPRASMVDLSRGMLRLGVPVPEVRPLYSARERREYGLPALTEVRLPVLAVAF